MRRAALAALPFVLAALAALAPARGTQIVALTLPEMMERADDAVFARVVERRAFSVQDPSGEGELYFTAVRLEGRSLADGRALTVDVSFPGGLLEDGRGSFNSESPAQDEVAPGRKVVAFYRFVEDMGGGVSGNVLYALHGGLYSTAAGPKGRIVLGRGAGYAVSSNRTLDDLGAAVAALHR